MGQTRVEAADWPMVSRYESSDGHVMASNRHELEQALMWYRGRQRRFGPVGEIAAGQ
jgi:hypothetical protein